MSYQPYQPTWNNPYLQQQPFQMPSAYQPAQMSWQSPTAQPVNGTVKVNGRESALQYQLPPNSMSPALFDKDGKVFYIVSTDGTGTKTVETFDFSPHKEEEPFEIDGAQFVSRREFDEFAARVNAVLGADNGVHESVPAATDTAAAGAAGPVAGPEAADVPTGGAGRHKGARR